MPTDRSWAGIGVPGPDGARLRTLLVATSFPASLEDWRGLFMRHLVDALGRRPDLDLTVWAPPGESGPGVSWDVAADERKWLATLTADGGIAHLLRRRRLRGSVAAAVLLRTLRAVYRRHRGSDVFHVNWLQNVIALPGGTTPLLVTALGTDMQLLRLPGMRALLRHSFRGRRVVLCPNAEWMVAPLAAAFGDLAAIRFIPFGMDPRWYSLRRSPLPDAAPKWLCVSRLTRDKLGPLFDWTEPAFAHGRAELHLFGPMQEQITLPDWVTWHGPATPDALRDTWFPRACGLITLSRHAEGRPQVMLEAMASGLPIIASRLPAHDDLLAGGGGVLCDTRDDVLAAISALSDAATNHELGARGRERARSESGTWDDCAARYAGLYRELTARASPTGAVA